MIMLTPSSETGIHLYTSHLWYEASFELVKKILSKNWVFFCWDFYNFVGIKSTLSILKGHHFWESQILRNPVFRHKTL